MNRVRVGLTGLAVVFLLTLGVSLTFGRSGSKTAQAPAKEHGEPLAQLGVAPGAEKPANPPPAVQPAPQTPPAPPVMPEESSESYREGHDSAAERDAATGKRPIEREHSPVAFGVAPRGNPPTAA